MCLGIPGRVVEVLPGNAGQLATVDVLGARRPINLGMLEDPALEPGDWVLIHMGFALEKVDEPAAQAAMSGLEMLGRSRDEPVRRRLVVTGVVQGVGFRPFVHRLAAELGLAGSVSNTPAGVVVEAEGDRDAVTDLIRRLRTEAPPLAVIEGVEETEVDLRNETGFTIETSRTSGRSQTLASPDVATCADCLRELADPDDRRHRHPFITCTDCGPRFSIITHLPYDRAATTMAGFAMCAECRAEYEDPVDRRFHAQPIACHTCGPRVELVSSAEPGVTAIGDDAIRAARAMLADGRIVAVKGIGGYHLACDARNDDAVAELRRRKRRGDKPFAVMVADLDVARGLAEISEAEEDLMSSRQRPIVLLCRREGPPETAAPLSDQVAPGSPDLGLMLAYSPLHALLFGLAGDDPGPDALVMTSGNLSGEPIVTDDAEARTRLAPLVDAWLRHDREIHVPCDDSVTRFVAGEELLLRRSRGHAPLPFTLPFAVEPTLAVGADLKNTCAVAEGRRVWMSQHIGDVGDLATVQALTRTERHLEQLTGVAPVQLVTDQHPGYGSAAWAREHAAGRPVHTVQHHHAHVAAVMGEHGLGRDEEVIGFAFDGTGYGTDGAVWGGEVLIAGYKAFHRAAHLAYVPLAGGDTSVRRPYRMALAHLHAAGVDWDESIPSVRACPPDERGVLAHQLRTGFGCIPTSSVGRLFDAVASLAGVRQLVDHEAQAAIELEALARGGATTDAYAFDLRPAGVDEPWVADPTAVVRAVVRDVAAGVPAATVSARFHAGLAVLIADLADVAREQAGLDVVALGGGVFSNAVLLGAAQQTLAGRGFTVLRPRRLPAGDGAIALGQILVGASA